MPILNLSAEEIERIQNNRHSDFKSIVNGDFVSQGKWESKEDIYQQLSTGFYYSHIEYRSGSYYSDYEYDTDCHMTQVSPVEKVIVEYVPVQ